tara:strand:+ start:1294 stop:1677 length:384 start_codon:yes stop_codon:yes gene_type:complete
MHNVKTTIEFEIMGEPASKANSRQLVTIKNRPAFIKSKKARDYLKMFVAQCPKLPELLEGDLKVEATIYYKSRRPDLDESVILDAMEKLIYANDRQVKEKHIKWGLDRENPRSTIKVSCLPSQDNTA